MKLERCSLTDVTRLGSGAGVGTEDCAVLVALLQNVERREDISLAFEAFDKMRSTRFDTLIRNSQEVGKIMTGQSTLDPVEAEKLNADSLRLAITDLNVEQHVQECVDLFRQLKAEHA